MLTRLEHLRSGIRSLIEAKVKITPERREFRRWATLSGHYMRFSHVPTLPARAPSTSSPTFEVDGVWAYPLNDDTVKHALMRKTEFADSSDYVMLLRPKRPARVIHTENYELKDFVRDVKRLRALSGDVVDDILTRYDPLRPSTADPIVYKFERHSPRIVSLKVLIFDIVDGIANQSAASRLWAHLYDGIDDEAGWLITPDGDYEQQQAIFFDPSKITVIDVLKNPCKFVQYV